MPDLSGEDLYELGILGESPEDESHPDEDYGLGIAPPTLPEFKPATAPLASLAFGPRK